MKWPWTRSRRQLDDAREERDAAHRRTRDIDAKVRKLEKHRRDNQFAARFNIALGGEPR